MPRAGASKTFTNTLGVWEIQDDGSVRLLRAASVPIRESRVKKYANSKKRDRTE